MSVNVYDPVNDKLIPVAGATLYADTPIGAIQAFDSTDIPSNFLEFKGQTVNRADYPDLWAHIVKNSLFGEGKFYGVGDGATTFTLADLRETSLKGYGETSRTVGAHVKSGGLGIGEFIDDRNKKHNHRITVSGSDERSFYLSGGSDSGDNLSSGAYHTADYSRLLDVTNQGGATTEVKAVGVVWAVKAKQLGLPIDLKEQARKQMFPDYAHPITIPDGTLTWIATEDCYIQTLYTTTDTTIGVNSRVITIDGQLVGTSDATSTVATRQFSGYVKKEQVVSSYDQTLNLGFSQYVKVFPLSS